MKQYSVVFTGGGTGGHVFPGIAVAEKLIETSEEGNISLHWIGNRKGMERDILERFNIPFYSIPAGKLRRYFSFQNFIDIFKIFFGFIASIWVLRKLKADLLFSKGGFVTVPPVLAAKLMGIPVISHESDLDPGLATRINGRFSDIMLFAYKETKESWRKPFSAQELFISGNPVRREISEGSASKGRALFNVPGGKFLLLVLGGSQGALEVNMLIEEIAGELCEDMFIVHQMGSLTFKESAAENYVTRAFFTDEFPDILAAADLVVSRAGAGTLWESGIMGKPAILIPLGTGSSRGDQIRNADYFASRGAAVVLKGDRVSPSVLLTEIKGIMDNKEFSKELSRSITEICNSDSSGLIADTIERRLQN